MAKTIKKIAGFENEKRFYRTFRGHEYFNSGEVDTRHHAEKRAEEMKKEGYMTHITKSTIAPHRGFAIWLSPKEGN